LLPVSSDGRGQALARAPVRAPARRPGNHGRRRDGGHLAAARAARAAPGLAAVRAEILAVGSELLTPLRSDTNALWLTERLLEIGIAVGSRVTVADDAQWLEAHFKQALARADVVIATGGLGPTEDDLT